MNYGTGINNTNGLNLRYAQGNPQNARTTGALTPGTRRFQDGGEMPAGDPMASGGAPEQGGAGGAEQIPQIAQAIVQEMGPEMAMMLAEAIMQMVQGQMGGAPEQAPQGAPQMAMNGGSMNGPKDQMFRRGGVINSDSNLKKMMLNTNYASVEDARSSFREFGINSNVAIVNSQRTQL